LGIGDWGLGPIPNPQSPIPNPQSPLAFENKNKIKKLKAYKNYLFYFILFNLNLFFYFIIKKYY